MPATRSLEFEGHDEEIEKHILEFAGAVGGGAARDPKRGGWVVSAGVPFATTPNALRWQLHIVRQGNIVKLASGSAGFPWTRSKRDRVAGFRQGQFADFLEARLRGRESAKGPRLREPFVGFGSEPAALSASLAWSAACGLGSCFFSLLACMLPALLLMNAALLDILQRTEIIENAGTAALPHFTGIVDIAFPWGPALLFALPMAFFLSLVHTAALLAGEISTRAVRLGLASIFFQAIFLGMAFLPVLGWLDALPIVIIVPLAAHAGYTMVWGRRGERVREEESPRRGARGVGVVLALAVLAMLIPRHAGEQAYRDRMAIFRDRYLLGTAAGRAVAEFYYTNTLAAAEPLKEFYSKDPDHRPMRLQRIARVEDKQLAPMFRALDFVVVTEDSPSVDVHYCSKGELHAIGKATIGWDGRPETLPTALDELSRQTFPASSLRDLSALSWRAVFYAGPSVALLMIVGFLSLGVAVVFRKLPRRGAIVMMAGSLAVAVGFMLHDYSRNRETYERVEALRSAPLPERITAGLTDPSWAVRHEAAFQAFHGANPAALTGALLQAVDDPDLRVRLWACAALGRTRDPRALPKLLGRLDDPEIFVRYRAAEGLGFLGRAEAVEPLERMMRNRGWYEGAYALQALRRIKPDEF